MLPSVLPTETDHVPVLAEEVVVEPRPAPGRDDRRRHVRRRRPCRACSHSGCAATGKLIAIDRDPTVAPFFERFRREHGVKARLHHGEFSTVLQHLAANGVQADVVLLDLGVSSMQIDRPERGFSYAVDAPLDMRMDPGAGTSAARRRQRGLSERELADIFKRYGEERYARPIARAIVEAPPRAAVRAHRRPRRRDQGRDPRAGAVRRGPSGEARLPGAPHRGERRARRGRARAAGGARDAASRRAARRDLVPLARGPARQAVPAPRGAGLHVPARLPGLRLRLGADDARDAAARDPPERGGDRPQPARPVGAPPRGDEGLAACARPATSQSLRRTSAAAVRAPLTRRARARRDPLDRDRRDSARRRRIRERGRPPAQPASRLGERRAVEAAGGQRRTPDAVLARSSRRRASPRAATKQFGLVYRDPSEYVYVNLAKK